MNIKKYVDESGLTHLWTRIEENYPTNEDLTNVVNAIDETKADKTDLVGTKVSNGEVFNDYTNNAATGDYSHAEGYKTQATGKSAHAEGTTTKAIGDYSHAEGNKSYANGKYSHAEGQMTNANGNQSHAEGYMTNAGIQSHAEGVNTRAEAFSHAEGTSTIALNNSHAEGIGGISSITISGEANAKTYTLLGTDLELDSIQDKILYNFRTERYAKILDTHLDENGLQQLTLDNTLSINEALNSEAVNIIYGIAYGYGSHAENYYNIASGQYSHAEGEETIANGKTSHTEGIKTIAKGDYSHAEGYYTIANGNYQHVQGKYNIEDTENRFAHIVGNGEYQASSNAHTLDWDGNAWFAGDVYVNSTSGENKDEGSQKLATEGYVNSSIDNALAGGPSDTIVEQNKNRDIKFWVGTEAELDLIETRDENCLYFTTDPEEEENFAVVNSTIVTLDVDNWTLNANNIYIQEVQVNGVLADVNTQLITISPYGNDFENHLLVAEVFCIEQKENALVFRAINDIPEGNVQLLIVLEDINWINQ